MDSVSPASQAKTVLDCTQFDGRKRAICEGTSELSPEREEQYRQIWAGQRRGFGDTVKAFIDRWVPECLKPKRNCGCKKRQEWLNEQFPY